MTYVTGGQQYLVIAAGGHNRLGTTRGDSIIAFALPDIRRGIGRPLRHRMHANGIRISAAHNLRSRATWLSVCGKVKRSTLSPQ